MKNDPQSNNDGNAPAGGTPTPLEGNARPNSRLKYSTEPHLLSYNSLAANAMSSQQQQLYAQAARAHQDVATASSANRLLAAGKPQEANNIGGVPIPPMAPGTPTNLRIEAAAQYAAGAAVPYNGNTGAKRAAAAVATAAAGSSSDPAKRRKVAENAVAAPDTSMGDFPDQKPIAARHPSTTAADTALMQKQQSNRDRNREHARSTRLRKKAYVNKLKELLDALHVERSDDDRKRRVAVQKLAEIQDLRRKVVHTFFGYHARCERAVPKWRMILEDNFWLKQPVTPYRSFRRCEIEKGSRITKGVEGMAEDAASMAVMIETIGSRNLRWLRRKRDHFLSKSNAATKLDRVGRIRNNAANAAAAAAGSSGIDGSRTSMPSIVRQNSRLQHAISSLSSSSESGHGSSGEDLRKVELRSRRSKQQTSSKRSAIAAKKVSCSGSSNQLSSSSNDTRQQTQQGQQQGQHQDQSNDYHDYHAPSLLDPLPESSDSVASDNCVVAKHMSTTDSSSEDDDTNPKKRKITPTSGTLAGENTASKEAAAAGASKSDSSMPSNIARSGISHSVKVLPPAASLPNGHAQLARAPAVSLPPFAGIGKKNSATTVVGVRSGSSSSSSVEPTNNQSVASTAPTVAAVASHNANNNNNMLGGQPSVLVPNQGRKRRKDGPSANYLHPQSNLIGIDDTTSSSTMEASREIKAYYHLNEDDMILTDNVLMCPFVFRSQDAVICGALSECVMPGMLRACFGPTNKLSNVEMIFDAMGFCQQLERASGNDSMAQIIPNSLEMALSPISDEARIITMSKPPYPIVSVNEAWTRVTGYTQADVEGKDLSILNGKETKDKNSDIESASKGQCACSVNVHYDINGRDFFSFVCSYPLTNLKNEVTHLLHVFQELPSRE